MVFCDEAYYDYINEPGYSFNGLLSKAGKRYNYFQNIFKSIWNGWFKNRLFGLKPELADKLFGEYSPYGRNKIMAQTNVLAVAAAIEALKDKDFYAFSLKKANEEKDKIYNYWIIWTLSMLSLALILSF